MAVWQLFINWPDNVQLSTYKNQFSIPITIRILNTGRKGKLTLKILDLSI